MNDKFPPYDGDDSFEEYPSQPNEPYYGNSDDYLDAEVGDTPYYPPEYQEDVTRPLWEQVPPYGVTTSTSIWTPQEDKTTPVAMSYDPFKEQDTTPVRPSRRGNKKTARERQRERSRPGMVSRPGETSGKGGGGFKPPSLPAIPNLDPRIPRYGMIVIISLVLIVIIVNVLGRFRNDPVVAMPNAVWIGTEWTYEIHTPETIEAYAQHLRDHQIGQVYAWVSWLQDDLTWRGTANFPRVRGFVQQLKEAYPELEMYGWVSFPVETVESGYRMDNPAIQQQIADFSAQVVNEFGFDSVFLNIEMVFTGDENFLNTLRAVRNTVGEDVRVSIAVPPDWSPVTVDIPVPPLIVPGTIWEYDYKQSVALLVDEMAIMAYNSGLSSSTDYAEWFAYQVQAFAEAVAPLGGTNIMMGMPTYDAEPPGHDPLVENIASAALGYRQGLQDAGSAASVVTGAAIYAGWTTDEDEWAQFRTWVVDGS